jgi:CubicO group peptidase (beta-lactamase class C family)
MLKPSHVFKSSGPLAAFLAAALLWPAAADAARHCAVPGEQWERASPEAAGMDAAKLQEALDYGTTNLGFAVRVYRRGCLVGSDRLAPISGSQAFESYSMAKSVTSLLFGRAMTLGLISPDDPVGSLVTEADQAHGEITMRDLLTMSSGLRWNGLRDYNIFTMRDRVRDALTLPLVHEPGTWFEYAQSAVALLVEAVERASGEDAWEFIQRRLFDRLGIPAGSWDWQRDPAGNIQGFYGVRMSADDYARLGELLRRDGVWRGKRLLSSQYLDQALSPSATNGCYGWLIWVNAGAPCIGATVVDRPVSTTRDFPTLPADMYNFSGLFGQRVTVFPSHELVIVRLGEDPGLLFSVGESWELGLYRRVLGAITDTPIRVAPPAKPTHEEPDTDYNFLTSLLEPEEYVRGGGAQDPLPPAGPARARAPQLELASPRVRGGRRLRVRLSCPPQWPQARRPKCSGRASVGGVEELEQYGRSVRYAVRAGKSKTLSFRLSAGVLRVIRRERDGRFAVIAINRDPSGGTRGTLVVQLARRH